LQVRVQQRPGTGEGLRLTFQVFLENIAARAQAKEALRHPVTVAWICSTASRLLVNCTLPCNAFTLFCKALISSEISWAGLGVP